MEQYPKEYVEHNLPLVLLSGLGERAEAQNGPLLPRQESGTRIKASSPESSGERSTQLLDQLLRLDGSQQPWNATALPSPSGLLKYRMKAIGRTYTLPPRKAAPLPQSPSTEGFPTTQLSQHRNTELYSPLSPLSPGSPIYPDGVFTPLWLSKHQREVPALLIAFFDVSTDDSTSQNEQIQIDINAIRTGLARSGFKTKFAAVLMSDKSILRAPELEDRLSAIRRATTLDPKTGLFFMPPMSSQAEIGTFVQSMLTTLQPLVVEYYRDLTKHARRKKLRGGPAASVTSPVEGGAHMLPTPGWNVRYEVKQGIFGEFRQEMDVAERHYSAAIEDLFGSEGALETTHSWSPRWNEARLLCDALALRVLRCQLWTAVTTGAAISWVNYKARMRDLVDRRGKGSQTYGWDGWESRWAEIMAQLIQHAALPSLQPHFRQAQDDSAEFAQLHIYASPEKSFSAADRLPPFQLLHHPGYWLRLAFQSAQSRREKALGIPEEDRTPPGQSPASTVAHRVRNYDTYLVPEPHEEYPLADKDSYDHIADLRRLANGAMKEFASRGQVRSAERLKFDLARQIVSAGSYDDAVDLLIPLWEEASWRNDDWEDMFRPLLVLLHDCALHSGHASVHLMTVWELLSTCKASTPIGTLSLPAYFARSWPDTQRVNVRCQDGHRLSPVSVSFAFASKETYVGEAIDCQIALQSHAASEVPSIDLTELVVSFSDGKTVTIKQADETSKAVEQDVIADLSDAAETRNGSLSLQADLRLQRARKRIYNICLTFRESGILSVQQVKLVMDYEPFRLEHVYSEVRASASYVQNRDVLEERPLPHTETSVVLVHPKPPKLEMLLHNLRKQYYVNEAIKLDVGLANNEDEAISATAVLSVSEPSETQLLLRWEGYEDATRELPVGKLDSRASHKAPVYLHATSEPSVILLTVEVRYTLLSDPGTPLAKTMAIEINVSMPFETKFGFGPLLYPDPWPSYFGMAATYDKPEGIPQRWRLGTQIRSSATESLLIRTTSLTMAGDAPDTACSLQDPDPVEDENLDPDKVLKNDFELVTRKQSFDDRRPSNLELSLIITWARSVESDAVTTSLAVPRLNLPTSEPRVLCTVADSIAGEDDLVLYYHLENPSTHFLTFALTMEANDEFAFSGPKYRTLSIAPLSRLRVDYHLLLHDQDEASDRGTGGRWIVPVLQVVDSYYHKALRVHSGGPKVRIDEKGGLSVLVQDVHGR